MARRRCGNSQSRRRPRSISICASPAAARTAITSSTASSCSPGGPISSPSLADRRLTLEVSGPFATALDDRRGQPRAARGAPACRACRLPAARADRARQAHSRGRRPGWRLGRCRRDLARPEPTLAARAAGCGPATARPRTGRRRPGLSALGSGAHARDRRADRADRTARPRTRPGQSQPSRLDRAGVRGPRRDRTGFRARRARTDRAAQICWRGCARAATIWKRRRAASRP